MGNLGRADYLWVKSETSALKASFNRVGIILADWLPVNGGDEIVAGGGNVAGVHFADINANRRAVSPRGETESSLLTYCFSLQLSISSS